MIGKWELCGIFPKHSLSLNYLIYTEAEDHLSMICAVIQGLHGYKTLHMLIFNLLTSPYMAENTCRLLRTSKSISIPPKNLSYCESYDYKIVLIYGQLGDTYRIHRYSVNQRYQQKGTKRSEIQMESGGAQRNWTIQKKNYGKVESYLQSSSGRYGSRYVDSNGISPPCRLCVRLNLCLNPWLMKSRSLVGRHHPS